MNQATEIFARLLRALEPYAADVVLIGGWVHALFLADANSSGHRMAGSYPVQTNDIDITIPPVLLRENRPGLIQLAQSAGFHFNQSTHFIDDGRSPDLVHSLEEGVMDLDFLTRAHSSDEEIRIEGQDGLIAHGYPDLHILTEQTTSIQVGADVHPLLDPPVTIRVPTHAAYVFQKGLASSRRLHDGKAAKDIVYMFEILRHPHLGNSARRDMPQLARTYPLEYLAWSRHLGSLRPTSTLIRNAAEQLIEANRVGGEHAEIAAHIVTQLRRLLAGVVDTQLASPTAPR